MLIIDINKVIRLKQLTLDDAPAIYETINSQREYLRKWLPFVDFTQSIADSEAFIRSIAANDPENVSTVFGIYVEGQFAGLIGYKNTDCSNKRTEVGYWLSEKYQGKGIITASVQKLVCFAFEERGLHRVQIKCAVGNIRSKNIPKRLGFFFEGIERDGELLADGKFTAIEVYSLLNTDSSYLDLIR